MKILRILFTAILILSSFPILGSFQISTSKASMHVLDYEQDVYDKLGNELLFSFKVRLIVEAEEDGTWRISQPGKNYSYRIAFAITLTYVNANRFPNPVANFDVLFHSPTVGFSNISPKYGWEEPAGNKTRVYSYRGVSYSNLGVRVTTPHTERRLGLHPSFYYKPYEGGFEIDRSIISTDGYWSRGPVYIDVTHDTLTTAVNELENIRNSMIILIMTTVALIAITVYRERKQSKARTMNTGVRAQSG